MASARPLGACCPPPAAEQARVLPEAHATEAIGITGFTLPTLHRWVRSDLGRAHSLHPYAHGLGRRPGPIVLTDLDGAIRAYAEARIAVA